ncbi:MAG: hypothetical protein F9K35_13630 [Burkholderiaceae bacterium]|nr:MAG: hypothetical protein F9K35_13630 [Burkholderiaceae bacterium]
MRTEPANEHDATAEHLRRMVALLDALGARITRLAQALDMPLDNPGDVERALLHGNESVPPHDRHASMREELRGLLVLRYNVVKRYADEVGAQAARDILVCAQDQLLREGFRPQAPGMDLRSLFDGF